jgi:hypothetical protein
VRKNFFIRLDDGDRLRVMIATDRGTVEDFVVQYEILVDGRPLPVVRYDGSHGRGHRDTLDERGRTIAKGWLPVGMTTKQALEHALDDLRTSWPRYRHEFLERLPR